MQISPYLNFPGTCRAAFEFYAQALGGEIAFMQTFGESPMAGQVPPEVHGHIMHVRLTVGDAVLMGSDGMPDRYEASQGFSVSLNCETPDEADRVFAALADGGEIDMPIQATFWAARFGMLKDRFGIAWMVNCDVAA